MSLSLDAGTEPKGLLVSTHSFESNVHLGGKGISVDFSFFDFLAAAYYVLVNTPLREDEKDARQQFVEAVRFMKLNEETKKLECWIPNPFRVFDLPPYAEKD